MVGSPTCAGRLTKRYALRVSLRKHSWSTSRNVAKSKFGCTSVCSRSRSMPMARKSRKSEATIFSAWLTAACAGRRGHFCGFRRHGEEDVTGVHIAHPLAGPNVYEPWLRGVRESVLDDARVGYAPGFPASSISHGCPDSGAGNSPPRPGLHVRHCPGC